MVQDRHSNPFELKDSESSFNDETAIDQDPVILSNQKFAAINISMNSSQDQIFQPEARKFKNNSKPEK